ncbi:MAG: PTS sugar transporter subunit IIC/EAL domain-containing protein [Anaeroplasma sp.]
MISVRVMEKIADYFFLIYTKLEKNRFLASIKQAFIMLIPIFMIGATALLLENFPISVIRDYISSTKIYSFLNIIYLATYEFATIYLVITVTYQYSSYLNKNITTRIFAVINSLLCYLVLLGPNVLKSGSNILNYTRMTNVFSGLITSLLTTRLFFLFINFAEKKRNKALYNSTFSIGINSIIPMSICLIIFSLIANLIIYLPINNIQNFNDLVIFILSRPFEYIGATYLGGLLLLLLESVLWLFGIHGSNVYESLNQTIFVANSGHIATKAFFDTFTLYGGCGSTLCLLIAILLFSKSKRKKKLGYMSLIPMAFNVNEIMVFGLPIVLNPIYVIPFIFTPIICYSISYLAVYVGIVPEITNYNVWWTTPVILSGYQATNSILGSLLQIFCVFIGTLIYIPFVKLNNRISEKNNSLLESNLIKYTKECEARNIDFSIESLTTLEQQYAEGIAISLNKRIQAKSIELYYQPQIKNDNIISIEGLLRFKYKNSNYLYPPLVINIADEKELFVDLTKVIIERAIIDLKKLMEVKKDISVAVNLKLKLLTDTDFRSWMINIIKENGIMPNSFGIEITEEAILYDDKCKIIFEELHSNGIMIYMDDFSMGNTSISILEDNYFDFVKLDGRLIRNLDNERSNGIVSTIIDLGKKLNFEAIAEYVETEEQVNTLKNMGCDIYQGYYYYKPMPIEDLILLLKKKENIN